MKVVEKTIEGVTIVQCNCMHLLARGPGFQFQLSTKCTPCLFNIRYTGYTLQYTLN